ncbi:hypothetical protein F5148DRAFT_956466, partial [Russula earlei]
LEEPLKLATHREETPLRQDPVQPDTDRCSPCHFDYSSIVNQRSLGGDAMEDTENPSQFLDALGIHATDDLYTAALEYGINLKDLAIIDRWFKGEIASTMDKLTKRALQAQIDTAETPPQIVDRESSDKVKQEEGVLSIVRTKAQARNIPESDAEAYSIIAAAKVVSERTHIKAEARAHATHLAVEAEAEAIRIKAQADADIRDEFAQEMGRRRQEIASMAAFGNKAVFIPTE